MSSEQVCKYCGREMDVTALRPMNTNKDYGDIFDLEEHITDLTALNNAAEIYDYLVALNYTNTYFIGIILPEMKKYIVQERMYGTMKDSALKKIKELCAKR